MTFTTRSISRLSGLRLTARSDDVSSQAKEREATAARRKAEAEAAARAKKTMRLKAGGKVAKGKPHRRVAGHKPLSREQVEFMASAKAAGKQQVVRGDIAGGGSRGGAAGSSGRLAGGEALSAIVAMSDAKLAATHQVEAPRGGQGFFATKGKHTKSDASLASLDLADEETVRELLGRLPVGHQNERAQLSAALEKNYPRWWQLLQSEFSLLLYGFGSKKALLEDFARKMLTDGGVIIVNGFFPSLTPKQILANAAAALTARDAFENLMSLSNENLLGRIAIATSAPQQQQQQRQQQTVGAGAQQQQGRGALRQGSRLQTQGQQQGREQTSSLPGLAGAHEAGPLVNQDHLQPRRLYIVLHNIDGQQLRSSEGQALLGELAAMPRVHLVASVDHVNAPLLWSKREAARFNWVWQEATTFAPYSVETAHLPQLLASKGEERHIRGATNVLRTLTPNARHIFRLLAEHQLSSPDEPGMAFHAFYTQCREQFLATSEMTLRSHLTEFVDHELTRTKRGPDGEDLVVIPFAADVLAQLLKEIE